MPASFAKDNSVKSEPMSKDVIESYIFSTARHDYGIYSERLLMRLVELAQSHVRGLDFKGGTSIGKVEVGEWGDAEVILPVRDILLGDDDKNYAKAKEAIRNLMGRFLEYEDDNQYKATQILNDVDVDKVSGKMLIRVNRNVWGAMLDFTRGFRRYELETAMKLQGKYAVRIYKLVSRQTAPITYSIAELRKMWGLADKYSRGDDLIKHTVAKAKEELDRVSPFSFDFIVNSSKSDASNKGKRGRPTITSVTFLPMRRIVNDTEDVANKQVDPFILLGPDIYSELKNQFQFDHAGIKAHVTLFMTAKREFDLLDFLDSIKVGALHAGNVPGYVVSALRKHLREEYHITIDANNKVVEEQSQTGRAAGSGQPASLKDIFGTK